MISKFNQTAKTDEEAVERAAPLPVQKAKVINVPDHPDETGYHQVYVKLYYDESRERAAVMTGKQGDVSIPEEGEDVLVLYGAADKPVVIGSWYPTDDQYGNPNDDLVPEYEEGDRIIGNSSGSYFRIREDGTIDVVTEQYEAVNIDRNSSAVYQSAPQTIPNDNTWVKVQYDSIEDDREDLYDTDTYSYTTRHDGLYDIRACIMFPNAGQNNVYDIGIFVNGTVEKRRSLQSVQNAELSLSVMLHKRLDEGDEIDVRVRQNSGSDKDTNGSSVTSSFTIERHGI